jgi:hypothetical protein
MTNREVLTRLRTLRAEENRVFGGNNIVKFTAPNIEVFVCRTTVRQMTASFWLEWRIVEVDGDQPIERAELWPNFEDTIERMCEVIKVYTTEGYVALVPLISASRQGLDWPDLFELLDTVEEAQKRVDAYPAIKINDAAKAVVKGKNLAN